jgi:hypothetical protein
LALSEQEHSLPGFHHVHDNHISTASVTIQLPGQVGITQQLDVSGDFKKQLE